MVNVALSLADNLKSFGIKSVYGDPVEIDGTTIIPVAIVQFGFGGGNDAKAEFEGADAAAGEQASGGGGGGFAIPVGAYLKTGDGVVFAPNLISLLAVSLPVICATGWALARVISALKK